MIESMPTGPDAPRLLSAPDPSLAAHLACFGERPHPSRTELISSLSEAGLSGRGGAGFPTGRKIEAITGEKTVAIGNGAEGEPLSRKDAELLKRAPHLVLDGLQTAATAIGADKAYLYLHAEATGPVKQALQERQSAGVDQLRVEVLEAPERFVAGEESAAIRRIEGGPALPRDRVVVAAVSGVRGRPTLVNNVETLAHLALIARFGPDWFRSVGDPEDPGTMLVTLSGAVKREGVAEVPTGMPLTDLLRQAGGSDPCDVAAVLVGGYHGSWIPATDFAAARLSRPALKTVGASPGAGIIHAIATTECGLDRTAAIARYLADQSAQQCGPCFKGLPKLADSLDDLAHGRANDQLVAEVRRLVRLVEFRGACRHPDGTARMVRSALHTFAADIELHRARRCSAAEAAVS